MNGREGDTLKIIARRRSNKAHFLNEFFVGSASVLQLLGFSVSEKKGGRKEEAETERQKHWKFSKLPDL